MHQILESYSLLCDHMKIFCSERQHSQKRQHPYKIQKHQKLGTGDQSIFLHQNNGNVTMEEY